ncbi:MAG: VWA domain-containing protein [Pseudomonadota bacterium]
MNDLLSQFHFIRPLWLWGILPALLVALLLWRQLRAGRAWSAVISAELLPHLLSDGHTGGPTKLPLWVLLCGWLLAVVALAGPSWERLPQPVERRENALVVLFDLSLSMNVEDISPSRLVRSRQKLLDLLAMKTEGTTGLVAYAGDAHVVSPLTDDLRTVANLLPALSPEIMPVKGSRPARALEQAVRLLRDSGLEHGQILLVTDGIHRGDEEDIAELLEGTRYRLSVLGVGTDDGGPIPTATGFLRDNSNNIVIASLDREPLRELAAQFGGSYSDLELSDRDINQILNTRLWDDLESEQILDRSVDTWADRGYWLALLLIPMALGAFRRGWLLCLLLLPMAEPGQAQDWQQLFQNRDQRGQQLLEAGDAAAAAETFKRQDWAAAARYQAGDYESALDYYQQRDTADDWYNRGNSLAKAGELEAAINAYDEALQRSADMEDAQFNKALVEQLLQQQQQQQQNSEQNQQQDDQGEQQQQENSDQSSGQNSDTGESDSNEEQAQNSSGDEREPQDSEQQSQSQSGKQEDSEQGETPQQAESADSDEEQNKETQQANASEAQDDGERERDMANEQWLRRIPDDPSGLLRRKFQYQSRLRQREGALDSNGYPIEDDDATRW